ncbi:hypothetical protein ABGB12_22220 [Actinocorallia sp. B10E7]|uniref:hypothetical protein n=1 Tax=Actinocorallia sp. B10E7 TaxID=3153558 RepID=UPI00325C9D9A
MNEIVGSASDLWMVGMRSEGTASEHVVLHFDGRNWKTVKRIPRFDQAANGLAALRDGSVQFIVSTNKSTTVWRYDRRDWTSVTAVKRRVAASALPDGTIWAITRPGITPGRFNGRTWTAVKAPSCAFLCCTKAKPCTGVYPYDLLSLSSRNVVVSYSVTQKSVGQRHSVVRWNGKKWSVLYKTGADFTRALFSDGKGGFWAIRVKPHTNVAEHYTKSGKRVSYRFDLPHQWLSSIGLAVSPNGSFIAYGSNFTKAMAWRLSK